MSLEAETARKDRGVIVEGKEFWKYEGWRPTVEDLFAHVSFARWRGHGRQSPTAGRGSWTDCRDPKTVVIRRRK